MWWPGPLGPIGTTPVDIILLPIFTTTPSSLPSSPSGGGARFVELGQARLRPQEGSGHDEGVSLPHNFFYLAFKMVYFGAFWADLLTMRDTCDTTTNTAAVAF